MPYTLKSNSTTAAATIFFVAENGLTDLVSAQTISALGGISTSTVSGRLLYGDGANVDGTYLQATLGGISAGQAYAMLIVGHYGRTAWDSLTYMRGPGGIAYGNAGDPMRHTASVPGFGFVAGPSGHPGAGGWPGYTFPDTIIRTFVQGRNAAGDYSAYVDGVGGTSLTAQSGSNGAIAAGDWKFGGRISSAGGLGLGIFALFIGITPADLVSYLSGAGGDTYSALLNAAAPVLSSPVGTQTGAATATVGATTDQGSGTLYAVVTTSATAPTATQIKAGQTNAGTAAVWSGSVAVSSTGAKNLSATGLTASTTYYAHLVHTDASSNNSNVVSSASFTTGAVAAVALPATTSRPGAGRAHYGIKR